MKAVDNNRQKYMLRRLKQGIKSVSKNLNKSVESIFCKH